MFEVTAKDKIRAIIMGGSSGFWSEVIALFERLGISVTCCEDVYSALAEIVAELRIGEKILVIGSLAQLCAEDMRFLQICADRDDTRCCCFVDDKAGCDIKEMIQALGSKASLAGDINDVEAILMEMTEDENTLQQEQKKIDKNEFALTRAEMDALCRAG